jgi:hypothetical protein
LKAVERSESGLVPRCTVDLTCMIPRLWPPSPANGIRQRDSTQATARTMSGSMLHLAAAHCRISSVVPVKPPVTSSGALSAVLAERNAASSSALGT